MKTQAKTGKKKTSKSKGTEVTKKAKGKTKGKTTVLSVNVDSPIKTVKKLKKFNRLFPVVVEAPGVREQKKR